MPLECKCAPAVKGAEAKTRQTVESDAAVEAPSRTRRHLQHPFPSSVAISKSTGGGSVQHLQHVAICELQRKDKNAVRLLVGGVPVHQVRVVSCRLKL